MGQREANGVCRDAGNGRFCKNRGRRQRSPAARDLLLLRQKEKVRSSSPVDEDQGLDPAAVAPEKRVRSQIVTRMKLGRFSTL